MNQTQLDEYRRNLLELRERSLAEVSNLERSTLNRSPKEESGDLSGYSIHIADAASDSFERDLNLTLASREQELLNDIEAALAKLESGEFGACEVCSKEIGETRLGAIPYARLCIPCKEREEKEPPRE